jgi:hypothetical protein
MGKGVAKKGALIKPKMSPAQQKVRQQQTEAHVIARKLYATGKYDKNYIKAYRDAFQQVVKSSK